MNTGKTLFAQLMDFLPWTTFTRIVDRYGGDHRVRTLSCAEQYRSMAFAQLTYRESLRDIETCLSVHASKLYHMGFRQPVRRSTLADANERRDWRIHAALAQRLITQARTLYVDEELGLDLTNTVYALDSTTIALCLSVFPWAHFRTTKAAVKMHTLLDLRGNIPSFIHISDGKLHDVHALDMLLPEAGAIYVVDRGYVDFARLYVLHQAGAFFVTRAKSNIDAHRVYSAPTDRSTGIICDQTISLDGFYTRQDYPELLRRIRFKDPESGKTLVFITNNFSLPAATICALYKSRWQVELFFKWIKQHLRIKQFYGTSENAVKTQIWIAVSVYVLVAIVKKRLDLDASRYTLLQILSVTLFEKMPIHQALAGDENRCNASQITNQLFFWLIFNRTLVFALICSNCALRSGCDAPSRLLRTDCSRFPSSRSNRPTVVELTFQPVLDSAAASFARLLHVQRNGDSGSPRVTGSTSFSSACLMAGWDCSMPGRPAPGWRIRPRSATPDSSSLRPLRIVGRDKPVASETRASPPYPMARHSVAAHIRRPRSSRYASTAAHLSTIVASSSRSRLISELQHNDQQKACLATLVSHADNSTEQGMVI